MLPTKTVFTQSGNLGGEVVNMKINEAALSHIMSVLTDLYSDPILAVIREYSTNAKDAHIAAGNKAPIEITLPNALSQKFVVRDYGIGLSKEDIIDIYSQYGASTKRVSDDFTGMLGIGCKSALTYTHQFSIRSVKDGVLMYVVVSRDASGAGTMEIIDESKTDEPNGVEITVPTNSNDHRQWTERANNFFWYWNPDDVLINGVRPSTIYDDNKYKKLSDNFYYCETHLYYGGTTTVVMGGIAYPVDYTQLSIDPPSRNINIILFVDIGTVAFTPSREELNYTSHTKTNLVSEIARFKKEIIALAEKEINDAETHHAAAHIAADWKKIWNNINFTYRGETIPERIDAKWEFHIQKSPYSNILWSNQRPSVLSLTKDKAFIIGYDKEKLTTWSRKKIEEWDKKGHHETYLFIDDPSLLKWAEKPRVFHWKFINKMTVGRSQFPRYDIIKSVANSVGRIQYQDLEKQFVEDFDDIYYMNKKEHNNRLSGFKCATILDLKTKNACIVFVPDNRLPAFLKRYPEAKNAYDSVRQTILSKVDAMDNSIKESWSVNSNYLRQCATLDESKVDDPEMQQWIKTAKDYLSIRNNTNIIDEANQLHVYWRELYGWGAELPGFSYERDEVNKLFEKYVLLAAQYLDRLSASEKEHVYIYVNAVYNEGLKDEI